MSAVVLVEVDLTSPEGRTCTLRFADRAIRPFGPLDSQRPNSIWDDRLIEPPSLRRSLFEDFGSLSPGIGYGVMTLANADGGLDTYRSHTWGEVRVWRWPEGEDFAQAVMLFRGEAATPNMGVSSSGASRARIGLYDARTELDRAAQPATYAGTNGQGGVLYEGVAGGLKGRVKPLAFGDLTDAHLPAPQVNAPAGVYQIHDGSMQGAVSLFDRGGPAGYGDEGDLSGAAFDAATPAAAHYRTDLARGLVKLNGAPAGTLTFGAKGDAAGGYVETAGPILARLLARAGVPEDRVGESVADLTHGATLGVWAAEGQRAADLTSLVARSVPAALLPDRQGVWQALAFGAPAAAESFAIAPDQVIALAGDDSAPLPVGEVRVGWGKIYTTFSPGDLAFVLRDTPQAEALASEFRWATATDEDLKARRPSTWRTLEITTALRTEAAAQVLAAHLLSLFGLRADGRPPQQYRVTLPLDEEVSGVELGTTVRLTYPARGIDDRFVLVGEEPFRPSRDRTTWTLWG